MSETISRAEVRIGADTGQLRRGLSRAKSDVNTFARGIQSAGGPAAGALGRIETAALGANVAMGLLAAEGIRSVSAGLQTAVQAARETGLAFAEVATIADSAQFPISRIRDISRELSIEFGGGVASQARALYQAISAGATDAARAQELLAAANKLAIGGVADLSVSIDGLTSVTNAYQASGLSASRAADVLFSAVRVGKTDVSQLASSLGQVAPIAATAGVSFEELTGAIAALTLNGVATAEAVTQIRGILTAVVKPTSEAAKVAKELGINFSLAELQSRGFQGFLQYIERSGASTEQLGLLLGRVEALSGALGLVGQNASRFQSTVEATTESAGAAEAAYGTVTTTLERQIRTYESLREAAAESFGRAITDSDAFRGSLAIVNSTLRGIVDLLESDPGDSSFLRALDNAIKDLASRAGADLGPTLAEQREAQRRRLADQARLARDALDEESFRGGRIPFRQTRFSAAPGGAVASTSADATSGRTLDDGSTDELLRQIEAAERRRRAAREESARKQAEQDRQAAARRAQAAREAAVREAEAERQALARSLEETRRTLSSREQILAEAAQRRFRIISRAAQDGLISEARADELRLQNAQRFNAQIAELEASRQDGLAGLREELGRVVEVEREISAARLAAKAEGLEGELALLEQSLAAQRDARIRAAEEREAAILASEATGAEREQLRLQNAELLQAELTKLTLEGEAERAAIEERFARERAQAQARASALQVQAAQQGFAAVISIGQAALQAQDQNNQGVIAAQKALAIAQVVVSTAVGVARALELGPIAAPAAAAAAIATGAAQIATIAATSVGSPGTVSSGPSASSFSTPSADLPSDIGGDSDRGRGDRDTIQVFAVGDGDVDRLVDLIADRVNTGDRVIIGRQSRQAAELRR